MNTTKNAKITIYDIRSIQAKVKQSILFFATQVEKITFFQKKEGGNNADGQRCTLREDILKEVHKIFKKEKTAKLTIYHIRSNQPKVKCSVLL